MTDNGRSDGCQLFRRCGAVHAARLALATAGMMLVAATLCEARADENDSLSKQARSMMDWLQQHMPRDSVAVAEPLSVQSAEQQRRKMREMIQAPTQSLLKGLKVDVRAEQIEGVTVQWLTPRSASAKNKSDRVAIYIHGGGYVAGEAIDPTVVTLADKTGLRTVALDYRLAPEHPFPAGRDDCLVVYRELVRRFGAERLVMYGGSAGGGMVIATVLAARDAGLPMPAAVAVLSPWTDLSRTGDSYFANEGRDPILNWQGLQASAEAYAGGKDLRSPQLSPVYADYKRGFPPTLITTGTRDLFLSNCVRLYRRLRQAGVPADLQVWEGMWHSFEGFTTAMPESVEAIAVIASFLTEASRQ